MRRADTADSEDKTADFKLSLAVRPSEDPALSAYAFNGREGPSVGQMATTVNVVASALTRRSLLPGRWS
jgi:hypothetical protein